PAATDLSPLPRKRVATVPTGDPYVSLSLVAVERSQRSGCQARAGYPTGPLLIYCVNPNSQQGKPRGELPTWEPSSAVRRKIAVCCSGPSLFAHGGPHASDAPCRDCFRSPAPFAVPPCRCGGEDGGGCHLSRRVWRPQHLRRNGGRCRLRHGLRPGRGSSRG